MIISLPDTTVSGISKTLVSLREEGGAVALGRVLTLVIITDLAHEESAIDAANAASREHPMRVLVLEQEPGTDEDDPHLDAEIRVGGDAGASEVVVLRAYGAAASDHDSLVTGLLLPDAPVVAWWSRTTEAAVADTPVGRIATRRITDYRTPGGAMRALDALAKHFVSGDTDLAWTRITLWRSQLAAVLDQPPYEPIERVEVEGASDSRAVVLLAAWLGLALECPVELRLDHSKADGGYGVDAVRLHRPSGVVELARTSPGTARLVQPGQPTHDIAMPQRTDRECLAEELRRLGPDEVYERVLSEGLSLPRTVEG